MAFMIFMDLHNLLIKHINSSNVRNTFSVTVALAETIIIVPVARLQAFVALKYSRLESFRTLQFSRWTK